MKSKRFWFRSILLLGLSVGVLGSLIAASPAWISDYIFKTGQTIFAVYNSSTQLIETVDNRNKARRQYGALTVDGALYANSTINATGAINIGADVSLSRSAADTLTTADTVVTATQEITGTGNAQVFNYYAAQGLLSMIDSHSLRMRTTETDWNTFYIGTHGVVRGILFLSGHRTGYAGGGNLYLGVSDDYNSTITSYNFQPIYDDLYIGPSSDTDSLIYDAGDAQWKFTGSGGVYVTGTMSAGTVVDRTPGSTEDAVKEIETWKVVGDQVDHTSLGDCAVDIKEARTGFEIVDKAGNIFNSIEEKFVPAKGSKDTDIQALSDMAEKVRDGIAEVSAGYQVKEVSAMVETKGRNISKTISTLSRAIQQLSERLDKLEGR